MSDVYAKWCEPIVAALWERNEKKIHAKLADARTILNSSTLFDDEAETLDSHLTYLEYQACTVSGDKGKSRLKRMHLQWIAKLETDSEYPQVNKLRASLLLQFCIYMDRNGLRTLDEKRFNEIETRNGEGNFKSETWYYVAIWAYKYGYIDVLEKAFTHFFDRVRAHEFYNEWSYHLTKVMFNIHSNCANKAEMQHIIALAKDPTQLKVFRNVVWRAATDLNLVDTEVCIAYDIKMKKLESSADSYQSVGQADKANTLEASRHTAS